MPKPISRSAFLYMDPVGTSVPTGGDSQFAQCVTCQFYRPERRRCALFIVDREVPPSASCNLYATGLPTNHQPAIQSTIWPSEAGYVDRPVRCSNCAHFQPTNQHCHLFELLNRGLSTLFSLDPSVHPNGCCNAQTEKS